MAKGILRRVVLEYDFAFWRSKDGKIHFGIKHSPRHYETLIEFGPEEYEKLIRWGLEPVIEDRGYIFSLDGF